MRDVLILTGLQLSQFLIPNKYGFKRLPRSMNRSISFLLYFNRKTHRTETRGITFGRVNINHRPHSGVNKRCYLQNKQNRNEKVDFGKTFLSLIMAYSVHH